MGLEMQSGSPLNAEVLLTPFMSGFEGVEKRLEVQFSPTATAKPDGLRWLNRREVDMLLEVAECTIVSELHNDLFDSYVLSESSLFIYPFKIVIKTCGRTQLLKCLKLLLSYASNLSLEPCNCKYTHGTFIFPLEQPYPHTSFSEEVRYLDSTFSDMILNGGREAYVMGKDGRNWYIYSATSSQAIASMEDIYTVEVCMTQLHKNFTAHFFNPWGTKSGKDMTTLAGFDKLLPNAKVCDFSFVPCGYSMNSMEENAFSTIHITPEDKHSYASFEIMGYDPHCISFQALINRLLMSFQPGKVVISIHGPQQGPKILDMGLSTHMELSYVRDYSQRQELPGGSMIWFQTLHKCLDIAHVNGQLSIASLEVLPLNMEVGMTIAKCQDDRDKKHKDINGLLWLDETANVVLPYPCKHIEDEYPHTINYKKNTVSSMASSVITSDDEEEHHT